MKKIVQKLLSAVVILGLSLVAVSGEKEAYQPRPLEFRGKPFFILGNHDSRIENNRRSVQTFLKGCGMNTVMFYLSIDKPDQYEKDLKEIRWYARNFPEIALIVELPLDFILQNVGPKQWRDASQEVKAQRLPRLEKAFQELRGCGNVIGYSLDELENRIYGSLKLWKKEHPVKKEMDTALADFMEDCVGWMTEAMRKNHPEALFMPIQAWWSTYDKSDKLYDVLIANEYPVNSDQQTTPTFYTVAYDAQSAASATQKFGKRCFVYCPPGFNVLSSGAWKGMQEYSREALRYLWFTPISSGAMGVFGWRQRRCTNAFAQDKLFPVMNEIKSVIPWLLGENWDAKMKCQAEHEVTNYKVRKRSRMAGKEDEEYFLRPVKTISWIARRNPVEGTLMILTCNNSGNRENCSFQLPAGFLTGNELFSNRVVSVKNGSFAVTMEPLSVQIFIMHNAEETR